MKAYIKPSIDINSAYTEISIMVDSTTNNSLPFISGENEPKIENGLEILTPSNHLWDSDEEEE